MVALGLAPHRDQYKLDWAEAHDIPGSRCGPEDGPWPRPYQVLSEGQLHRELKLLAKPQSTELAGRRADSVNFQPSRTTRTQDRYVTKTLSVGGQEWSLTGVFDGHLGHITVEHVAHHLPIIVAEFLQDAYRSTPTRLADPVFIEGLFSRSMVAFDDAIARDVLDLFGGIDGLAEHSDADIRRVINDGGDNFRKARLNMYGTTALVALVDPDHGSLWVANLGDCQATLVTHTGDNLWDVRVLTTEHNGFNQDEVDRVKRQHPNEPECVLDGRVLGALAPFRCLGDTPFKQPPEFTRRILYNLSPGFPDISPWEEFLVRNRTPPYISTEPEVIHTRLSGDDQYLILCSDGFVDLCSGTDQQTIVTDWITQYTEDDDGNMALALLRHALGGQDTLRVSKVLTLEMDGAWIDDTSLIVQRL